MDPGRNNPMIQVEIVRRITPGRVLVHSKTGRVVVLIKAADRIFERQRIENAVSRGHISAPQFKAISVPGKIRDVQDIGSVSERPAVCYDHWERCLKEVVAVVAV